MKLEEGDGQTQTPQPAPLQGGHCECLCPRPKGPQEPSLGTQLTSSVLFFPETSGEICIAFYDKERCLIFNFKNSDFTLSLIHI